LYVILKSPCGVFTGPLLALNEAAPCHGAA